MIDQLDERTREVQDLKTKLQHFQSELQSASDRENFVMAELAAQVHDLNCEYFLRHDAFVFAVLPFSKSRLLLRYAGIRGPDEERSVDAELQELASGSSASFWTQSGSARVLLTLRHRVRQVSGVIGTCHVALMNAYTAMFPLDERPHGIFGFARKFSSYEKAKLLVRHQLVGGAKVALAIAKTHYPQINFSLVARGPKAARGQHRVTMTDKYEAAHSAALDLMLLAEEETEAELKRVLEKPPRS